MRALTQNQTAEPLVFMLVSSGDHVSPVTGAAPSVSISKNGGAFGAVSGAVTEIGNGWYKVAGHATDSNTLGPLIVHITAPGCDPSDHLYQVVAFNPRDSVSLGLTLMPSNVLQISGDSVAADNVERWFDGTVGFGTSTSVITGSLSGSVGSVTGNVGGSVTGSVGSVLNPASIWTYVTRTLTGAINANIFSIAGDEGAADNLVRWFGGGGGFGTSNYNIAGNLTGAVGSVTGDVNGNVIGSVGIVDDITNIQSGVNTTLSSIHGAGSWSLTIGDIGSIQSGLATTTHLNTVQTITTSTNDRIVNMTELVPTLTDYRYTAQALEEAPTGSGAGEVGGDFSESEEDYVLSSLTEIKNIVSQTKTLIVSGGGVGGDINNSNIVVVAAGNMDNKYSQPTLVLPEIPANFEEDAGTSRVDFANALFAVLRKATVTGITQTQPAPYDLTSLASKVEALEEQKVPKMRSVIVTGVSDANVSVGFADIGTTDYIVLTQVLADSGVNIPTVTFSVVNNSQLSNGVTIRCDGAAVGLQILVSIIERVQ